MSHPAPPSALLRTALLPALVAGLVVLALGCVADRQLAKKTVAELRADQARVLEGYAAALERQMAKYSLLTISLAAWTDAHSDAPPMMGGARDTPPEVAAEFEAFAAPLLANAPAVRAFNLAEGTVIASVYPPGPNAPALGLDLATHTIPTPVAALRRSLATGQVSMAGPLPLAQGGSGLLLFLPAGSHGSAGPLTAEVVVDVDRLIDGVGISSLSHPLELSLTTSGGAFVIGDSVPADPAVASVNVPEGVWTLAAAPVQGWAAAARPHLWPLRIAMAALALVVGILVYRTRATDVRLRQLVAARTARLEEVTQRMRATERFRESALMAGQVDVWSWDVELGTIKRSGAIQSALGAPEEERDVDYLERVHPDDREPLRAMVEELGKTGTFSIELRERMGSSGWRWVRAEGRCVASENGRPKRIIGAGADVTRLKNLEADLLHGGRVELMGQLAGGVVHDINNALCVVQTSMEMVLLDDESTMDDYVEAAEEATVAVKYAAALTGQVLGFARRDAVNPVTFAWDDLCRETAGFLARVLGARIQLETVLSAQHAHVRLDRTQAMQVLANLATNARDAMGDRGSLRIETRRVANGAEVGACARPGPAVVTAVIDSGSGVPLDVQDTLFDAFVTTKGVGKGTGLGLSTSRTIALDAGGDLCYETSAEGTTFYLVLPVVDGDGAGVGVRTRRRGVRVDALEKTRVSRA